MPYTAGEVAAKLGLSKDGLRYYEREGILPPIARNTSGHREYSEGDIEWIFLICCLRDTDMPMQRIKRYVGLLMEGGGDSVSERRQILADHKLFLEEKMKAIRRLIQMMDKKLAFYDEALGSEDPTAVKCMDYAAEWEHFRSVLGGDKHD